MITLESKPRGKESADALRKKGLIPAVFYGPKEKAASIALSLNDFLKVWKQAGESSIVNLKEGSNEHDVLIYDVDMHPVSGVPRHADFYVIEKGKKVKVKTPLVFNGVAPAVKDLGGTLIKVLHQLEIEALPKDLPHEIAVDISPLVAFDSQILAKDIKLPAGVDLVEKPEEVVASVYETVEEVEAAPMSIEDIEVEKKGKKEEEGEAGAEPAADAKAEKKPEGEKK